jgi:hypothetical protein
MHILLIFMFFHFIPNRLLYSVFLTQFPTPNPADESMKYETPRTGILNFTHMTISFSRFIYFTCHTSFLVQRDHTLWVWSNFSHHRTGYFPLQFHTRISNFMFHKSTPTLIFLRFTFIHTQVSFLSFILSFIKYNIFSQAYIVRTTRGHHTIVFHTTFLIQHLGTIVA